MGVSTTVGEGETKSHKILELDEKVVSILHDCLLSGVHCQSKCDVTMRGATDEHSETLKLSNYFCSPLT